MEKIYSQVPAPYQSLIDEGTVRVLGSFRHRRCYRDEPYIVVRIHTHYERRCLRYLSIGEYRVPGGWQTIVHHIGRPDWLYWEPDEFPYQLKTEAGLRCVANAQRRMNNKMEIARNVLDEKRRAASSLASQPEVPDRT